MKIDDNYIKKFKISKFSILLKKYHCEYYYLLNRFNDSESIQESYYRIKNDIEHKPICPICGKPISFNNGFKKTCGNKQCISKITADTYKKTCLERYGVPAYNNIEKSKQTCLERYGYEHASQSPKVKEKCKQTCKEKYGVEYVSQLPESTKKSKLTRLKKYNNWNSSKNREATKNKSQEVKEKQIIKTKQTKLERYGDENYNNKEKYKETCIKKYNVEYPNQSPIIRDKYKQTCLEKYGVDNYRKTKEYYLKIDWKEKDKKTKQTKLERYGDENYTNSKKHVQTCIDRYGVKYVSQLNDIKEKKYNTRKKNNTFNTSKTETETYKLLKEKYPDVQYQYKSDIYPFACDFYIPSLDLYIECNYHWTHGKKPYEGTKEDNLIIEQWKQKNTKFYNNAIDTWTVRDVKKREIAIKNNLNYLLFYNINELKDWLNTKN